MSPQPDAPKKPRVEVVEESREVLEVLEQDRLPRPEKMAREQAFLANAHEVRYAERRFHPRHGASLDEVRQRVDALTPRRRELPEPRAPAPLPPPPAPEPQPEPVSADHEAALAPVVPGKLVRVEVVEQVAGGQVVEATYESGSATRSSLYVLRGGEARPFEDIAARVDALPTPTLPEPAPTAAPAPESEPQPTPAPVEGAKPKKGLFGRGKKAETPKTDAPAEPAKEKKSLFGRAKKAEAAPKADAPAEAGAADEPAAKRKFGLRRK